jgi:(S)-2-hydroxy-acid oxidase
MLLRIDELEKQAQGILDKGTYDYIAGGAGNEWGLNNNQQSFSNYQIVPRVLQGTNEVNTSLKIFGTSIPSPVIIGPCAFHKLVCHDGEVVTAKAAAKVEAIMTLSTMSSCALEEVAESCNSSKWFQLYIYKDRNLTTELIKRAENAGYQAIVVTVDVPAMGMRLRDIKNKFSLPKEVEAANFRQTDLSKLSDKTQGSKVKDYTDQQFDSSLSWDTIDWLYSVTNLPIILKGILNPEDALEAIRHNISGIIVSNHGGRQIDSVISSVDALADIFQVIQNKVPLILDSGIRSGEDIFKAIALGANAVMIARPVMWALAIGGEEAVISVLQKLQEELTLTMRLTGCQSLDVIRQRGLSLLAGSKITQLKITELEDRINQLLEQPTPLVRHSLWIKK